MQLGSDPPQVGVDFLGSRGYPLRPELIGHPGGVAVIVVSLGVVERAGSKPLRGMQKTGHLGDVDPGEELGIRRRIGPAVGRDAVNTMMYLTYVFDGLAGIVGATERCHPHERRGPAEPPQCVVAIVGVFGDAGHGEGVQGLEEQRAEPPDHHGGQVTVDPAGDTPRIEEGLGGFGDPSGGCSGRPSDRRTSRPRSDRTGSAKDPTTFKGTAATWAPTVVIHEHGEATRLTGAGI